MAAARSVDVTSHDGALAKDTLIAEKGHAPVETKRELDTQANVASASVGDLTWTQRFDQLGNVVEQKPPDRPKTEFDYDARGNLTAEDVPGPGEIKHGYDPSGGVSSYRDPIGETSEVTETITDRIGRPRQRTYADNTTEIYEYDGPRLHSMKDRQNRIYTYIYKDGTGQLSELRIGADVVERFDYDHAGRLNKWRTRDAELQFDNFDDEGQPRVTRQIRFVNRSGFDSNPQVLNTLVQEHEWNVHGERNSWTMPAFEGMNAAGWTKSVSETHDAAGNVETITRTLFGATAPSVLLTSSYRNSGRPDVRTLTTATGASIVRTYGYDPSTAMLNDMTVAGKGGVVVGGSRITYDGVQIATAVLHGLSAEARANEYDYDERSRLLTSSAAREQGSVPSAEVVDNSDFRKRLERPANDPAALPSLEFAHAPGHKIAQLTRGDATRKFSYGNGAERIDDDRFEYEFDARGRLITATQKATNTASPRHRFRYYYSAADRVIGRRAEYWSTSATEGWKLGVLLLALGLVLRCENRDSEESQPTTSVRVRRCIRTVKGTCCSEFSCWNSRWKPSAAVRWGSL